MNVVCTRELSKSFRHTHAVEKLNLEIPEGSIFALVGPNGAGKTTAIKTLMNILRPSAGSAEVLGTDSQRLGPAEFAQIGYVSENQELPLWMTVDYFMFYLKPFYPHWDNAWAEELLRQLDLPRGRRLQELSRGMRIKAALASSLAGMGCAEARRFIRFLPFGLTLRSGAPTVTVRNRYFQLSQARGP